MPFFSYITLLAAAFAVQNAVRILSVKEYESQILI